MKYKIMARKPRAEVFYDDVDPCLVRRFKANGLRLCIAISVSGQSSISPIMLLSVALDGRTSEKNLFSEHGHERNR